MLVMIDEPEVWGVPLHEPNPDSSLGRPFPPGRKFQITWHGLSLVGIMNSFPPYFPNSSMSKESSGNVVFINFCFFTSSSNPLISQILSEEN